MQIPQGIKTIDNGPGDRGSRSISNSIVIGISIGIVEDAEHIVRTVAQGGGREKRGLSGAARNRCRNR